MGAGKEERGPCSSGMGITGTPPQIWRPPQVLPGLAALMHLWPVTWILHYALFPLRTPFPQGAGGLSNTWGKVVSQCQPSSGWPRHCIRLNESSSCGGHQLGLHAPAKAERGGANE
jgi:hypothetical protein